MNENKPCVQLNGAGIEVIIGIVCITVMVGIALFVLKAEGKDIAIGAVSVIGGWLGKTAYGAVTEKTDADKPAPTRP